MTLWGLLGVACALSALLAWLLTPEELAAIYATVEFLIYWGKLLSDSAA